MQQWLGFGSFLWKAIVSIGVIAGLVAFVYSFAPSLEVSSYLPLDPSRPFTNLFKVSNRSWLEITSVKYPCRLNRVVMASGLIVQSQPNGMFVEDVLDAVGELSPNKTHDVRCALDALIPPSEQEIVSAEIEFIISFNYLLIPWRSESRFCFKTQAGTDGRLQWLSKPCPPHNMT